MNLRDRLEGLAARLPSGEPEAEPKPVTAAGAWERLWPTDMRDKARVVAVASVIGLADGAANLWLAGMGATPTRWLTGSLLVALLVAPLGPAMWRVVETSGTVRRRALLALALATFATAWLFHVVVAAVIITIRAAAFAGLAVAFAWGLWHRNRRRAAKRQRSATPTEGYVLVPIKEHAAAPSSSEP